MIDVIASKGEVRCIMSELADHIILHNHSASTF